MRQKRAKAYKKLMALYHISFGFREPYQVLVDSAMCTTSTALKLDLVKQFASVLQGNVKPMITQCCMVELYKLGRGEQPAVDLAKSFERRKCNHREAIPGDDCVASVVGETNKHRYVIASDSQEMRTRLQGVPGVPVVHLNRTVMVLEPPSEATMEAKRKAEEKALLPASDGRPVIGDVNATELKRKRKGPKGPNPLSVKKKKIRTEEVDEAKSGVKGKVEDDCDAPSGDIQDSSNKPKRKRRKKVHVANTADPD
ncbi:Fcf1-domain-containing protein [Hysterangium stoloniferum]|nr:Fcf1-domain-containing protein [Hysterangium stoloniferum]